MNIIKYFSCWFHAAHLLYQLERWPVLVLAATLLITVPIVPIELWLVKTLVNRIQLWTTQDPLAPILTMVAWLAALMVTNNIVLGVPIPMAMTRLNEIGTLEGQRQLISKTARLPLATIEEPTIKDLRERALQVSLYEIYNTGAHMLQLTLKSAILVVVMLMYGQWLPVIAVGVATVLLSLVSGKSAGSLEMLNRKQTSTRRLLRYYAGLMTKRDAAKEIRLFGLGGLLADRWKSLYEQQAQETWGVVRSAQLRKVGPELLMALLSGLLIALMVLLPGANKLNAGDFFFLFMALTLLLSQLPILIGQGVTMRKEYMKWEDYRVYLELEEDHNAANEGVLLKSSSRLQLQVCGLRFRYPGAKHDTLFGINLTIPPGCRAAVVGENGSGKSTLVKLLTRLYTPSEGEIVWSDGERILLSGTANIAGEHFSAVFQDFTHLYMTLRENVALSKLSAIGQDSTLQKTLQSVGSKLGDLDSQLGASFGGIEPSGGEWQKIVTARALLRDAKFVFFDEPTSALDPEAEKEAFDLFLQVTTDRSALLVTHRLGAAKLADVIFVMKQGRLVEQGTHTELMNKNGEYSRMFHLQAAWYV